MSTLMDHQLNNISLSLSCLNTLLMPEVLFYNDIIISHVPGSRVIALPNHHIIK